MPTIGGRLQRRDVDGPIRRSRAGDRRLDGERDGSKSRGPCRPVAMKAPAMAPEALPAFSGSRPQRRLPRKGTSGRPKNGTGHKTPRRVQGAERQPVAEGPGIAPGPSIGCGVGPRVPVAPSLAPPAGLSALHLPADGGRESLPRRHVRRHGLSRQLVGKDAARRWGGVEIRRI